MARPDLSALRAARAGQAREYKVEQADVYDEVDEADYRAIVRNKQLEDDFIEDDDGSGYVDTGVDPWDAGSGGSDDESEEEDEKAKKARRAAKKAKEAEATAKAAKTAKAAAKVKAMTARVGAGVAAGANPYMKAVAPELETDFMDGLLSNLAAGPSTSAAPPVRHAPAPATYKPRVAPSLVTKKRKSDAGGPSDSEVLKRSRSEFSSSRFNDAAGASSSDLSASESLFDLDLVKDSGPSSDGLDVAMTTLAEKPAADDDDDVPLLDAADLAKAPRKPKAPIKRQLVNLAATKVNAVKREPTLELAAVEDSKMDLGPASEAKPSALLHKKKTGMDWKKATESLAQLANEDEDLGFLNSAGKKDDDDDDNGGVGKLSFQSKRAQTLAGKGPKVNTPQTPALADDGSLKFYWLDFVENRGVISLIGRCKSKADGKWVSACVHVNGIQRRLFVLPRKCRIDVDGDEIPDDLVEHDDVEEEITDLTEEHKVKEVAMKWERMKYAFEKKEIPTEETDWLKLIYSYKEPQLPLLLKGDTFSHVFGTNASAFENLVLDRKIMGPSWLNVRNAKVVKERSTWCKVEVEIDEPDFIGPFADSDDSAPKEPPPLTIMSIAARTAVNLNNNTRELVCISMRTWQNSSIDDTTPIEKQPSSLVTLVRPLFAGFPQNFPPKPTGPRETSSIMTQRDERTLLNVFVAQMSRFDPDVLISHEFSEVMLDIILTRMKELKCDQFSKIGRCFRPRMPALQKAGSNTFLLAGRLICDLKSKQSISMIEGVDYSLTEMCDLHLSIDREDIDSEETPHYFSAEHSKAGQLLHFVQHCEADTYFQMAIAFRVQALMLTRQLTNLAGTGWNDTLRGNRSERNEYILLHEFNALNYVCPDKLGFKEKKAIEQVKAAEAAQRKKKKGKGKGKGPEEELEHQEEEEEDYDDQEGGGRKVKYKGGLVFEPQRGLHDRFVLVMDFNSLYPSIIQQYDIDFTTIGWAQAQGDPDFVANAELSATLVPTGVLPKLLGTLVARRKQVKGLMKSKGATQAQLQQWDIRQKALKLTANSMYGCLGYDKSRFRAMPLAAMTTFKGREALTKTKEAAEKMGLNVVYGDTDSVMINTNAVERETAIKIGNEFKQAINESHTLLEIETDAVFQRILLLQKKKYAALKVNDDGSTSREIKGLDMKRREYSGISKEASAGCLDFILSGEPTEISVENIHEYLVQLAEDIRAGKKPLDDFILHNKLGKDPSEYKETQMMPQVAVALKLRAKNRSGARKGDVVPYIYCLGANGQQAKTKADKAQHPDELRRAGSELKIDYEFYLSNQILPPVERLCAEIEGTDRARLAECLGLDTAKYQQAAAPDAEREFHSLQSKISDTERYKDCDKFKVRCPKCKEEHAIEGLMENSAGVITSRGFGCPTCVDHTFSLASLTIQLDQAIRSHIARFYEGWLICDDQSCATRTRMMSVYGRRCLNSAVNCRGQMHFEYTDSKLYTQLLYFEMIFDSAKAVKRADGTQRYDEIKLLADANKTTMDALGAIVTKHLAKNGRRWVGMANLFSFMKIKA